MTLKIRRVVTGHDADGKAVVWIDEIADNPTSRRRGHDSQLIWITDGSPADNASAEDMGKRAVARPPGPGGALFRIMEIQPGGEPEMHFTETIDYAVVMSGAIQMELDDGKEVTLSAGDVLVQRGTIHSWHNRGDIPCRIAAVLIDANPLEGVRA